MRACNRHWTMLREAIIARGLGAQIAADSDQAVAMAAAGKMDPLCHAYLCIALNTVEVLGFDVCSAADAQALVAHQCEVCPLCFMHQMCTCARPDCQARIEVWIERAADEQLELRAAKA